VTLQNPKFVTLQLQLERRLNDLAGAGKLNGTMQEAGVSNLNKDLVRLERQ
jgi:hypothetical protein